MKLKNNRLTPVNYVYFTKSDLRVESQTRQHNSKSVLTFLTQNLSSNIKLDYKHTKPSNFKFYV